MAKIADQPRVPDDWARQLLASLFWWCAPIAVGVGASFAGLSTGMTAFIWAAAFAWMAAGCLLNALRCHRLHCYISGPVLLLGALVVASLAAGLVDLGPHGLNNVVSVTFVLVLLSFAPELFWKRYA